MHPSDTIWRASAPGSLMLMGEHAVLHGKRALVCAVNKRMRVTLTPRTDDVLRIESELGEAVSERHAIEIAPPFTFVWTALKDVAADLPGGCDIEIESDFSSTIGFGSSAAVTVAVLAALDAWRDMPLDRTYIHQRARQIIQSVQGCGSGADAAASVYGGIVEYCVDPFKLEPLHAIHPITVIYSGYKTPTPEVIKKVEEDKRARPFLFDGFYYEIGECVRQAVDAICRDEWAELGELFNRNQALMGAIGVSDDTLEEIVLALREQPGILGTKISGSGLGDCVVGLGQAADWPLAYERIDCAMTESGVQLETD